MVGCGLTAKRPTLELALAAAAFTAAQEAQANVKAPNIFRKAEIYFLKAKSSYRRKYFNKAKQYALLSKKYAERAEYESVKQTVLNSNQGIAK